MKSLSRCNEKGVTLVEVIVAMAVAAVIFGLGSFVSFNFYKNYALQSEKDVLLSVLRKSRSQASNNISAVAHGVYVGDSSYTIFYGDSYVSRDAQFDEEIKKSAGISSGGLNEIVFRPLSATSSASGTISLSNGAKSVFIDVNYEGRISPQ